MQVSRGGQALHATHRTIIHLDLDCFYAQVEQKRLSIPAEVPCAVQQWEGLIAINYAARAQGITRHMRVHEAKARCPELVCVHVQTIGEPQLCDATSIPPCACALHSALCHDPVVHHFASCSDSLKMPHCYSLRIGPPLVLMCDATVVCC